MLEGILWPEGPVCPHCKGKNVTSMNGKTCRPGLKQCRTCRKQFTVTVGTIFERTHIGLGDWMYAFTRICSSKKGISALQLQRELQVQYKTAWFMLHRIRHAMTEHGFDPLLKGDIEVDEAYVGGKPRHNNFAGKIEPKDSSRTGRGTNKTPIMVLVERNGKARCRVLADVTASTLRSTIESHVDKSGTLHTDEFNGYTKIGREFQGGHKVVKHSTHNYWDPEHGGTNWAESYFALIKRGVYGTFHSISKKHLFRYMNEFEYRWNSRHMTDDSRTLQLLAQTGGRRLMYKAAAANTTV